MPVPSIDGEELGGSEERGKGRRPQDGGHWRTAVAGCGTWVLDGTGVSADGMVCGWFSAHFYLTRPHSVHLIPVTRENLSLKLINSLKLELSQHLLLGRDCRAPLCVSRPPGCCGAGSGVAWSHAYTCLLQSPLQCHHGKGFRSPGCSQAWGGLSSHFKLVWKWFL